jgi:S-adenosylmethionine synthetase
VVEPQVADLQVRLVSDATLAKVQAPIREIFNDQLGQMMVIRQELVDGIIKVY